MSKEYTEDEFKTAVAVAVQEATAALQAKLDEYEKVDAEAAVEAKIAEAVATKDAEIAELNGKLDTLTLEAEEAKKQYGDLVAFLEAEAAAAEEAAALEARKEARLDAVKEFAFTEDQINERLDRWVAMEDEDFAALLDDWKAVAKKAESANKAETTLPTETAMTATREDTTSGASPRREILGLRFRGVDPRKL